MSTFARTVFFSKMITIFFCPITSEKLDRFVVATILHENDQTNWDNFSSQIFFKQVISPLDLLSWLSILWDLTLLGNFPILAGLKAKFKNFCIKYRSIFCKHLRLHVGKKTRGNLELWRLIWSVVFLNPTRSLFNFKPPWKCIPLNNRQLSIKWDTCCVHTQFYWFPMH